jgi:hypothetical protein
MLSLESLQNTLLRGSHQQKQGLVLSICENLDMKAWPSYLLNGNRMYAHISNLTKHDLDRAGILVLDCIIPESYDIHSLMVNVANDYATGLLHAKKCVTFGPDMIHVYEVEEPEPTHIRVSACVPAPGSMYVHVPGSMPVLVPGPTIIPISVPAPMVHVRSSGPKPYPGQSFLDPPTQTGPPKRNRIKPWW